MNRKMRRKNMKNKTRIIEVEENGRTLRIFQVKKKFLFFSWYKTQPIPQERLIKVLSEMRYKLMSEIGLGYLVEGDIKPVAIDHLRRRVDYAFTDLINGIKEGKL